MHREQLLSQLDQYSKTWTDENSGTTEPFRAFVQANEGCFERSLEIGHITGSAWVVDASGERVLLTHHRKLDRWLQLGGHADGDSDVFRVAVREAEEESGLRDFELVSTKIFDLDVHPIPARKNEAEHQHFDVRIALRYTGDKAFVVSDESHDLAWVPVCELETVTNEESMLRMARKWLEFSGHA
ncbi:MAG: 8-oxo-dGTP pyrophosphatase MutT (NUDIX family) [Verrucomicrobiales bacterium]|jgi:8-oxo-dGTP pyrophosphatase MutT (NUDIX family)